MPGGAGTSARTLLLRARSRLYACRHDRRGGISVVFCVGLLAVAVIACGAIEMTELFSERNEMRGVADSAALYGASSLTLTGEDGVEERTTAFAQAQLTRLAKRTTLTFDSSVIDLSSDPEEPKPALKVTIRGNRPSFFGGMFPPGGFNISVSSTAVSVSKVPLCILGHGGADALRVKDTSNIVATGCLVHSNENVRVEPAGKIDAGLTQAVGSASGPISPKPNSGAKRIDDPFADLNVTPPKCPLISLPPILQSIGLFELPAGVHCQDLTVVQNATLRLASGKHYFVHSKLKLHEDSKLEGTAGSVLIFDKDSDFDFKDRARVNLVGMKTGDLAGFLIIATRDNKHDFNISAENVDNLLGTIYLPAAKLIVDGEEDVARNSPWTVIVAKQLELKGNPTLVMNTDYATGGVPVPMGVGAKSMDTRIVK